MILPLAALLPVMLASADGLAAAYVRGDLDEVARLGGQLGASGLAPLLAGPAAPAAIAAAPAAPDAWELLADLAVPAAGWDRALAAPAARAAAQIARHLDAGGVERAEIADDDLAASQATWLALARRADRWADVRVHALEVVARVAAARAGDDPAPGGAAPPAYDLAGFLADGDPEVRRAALELLPQPLPAPLRPALATAVADDADPAVALAAAQALCADLGFGAPAAPVLTALGGPGLARLRTLVAAGAPASQPALLDAARCLAADGSRESADAVRALAAKAPPALHAPLERLQP